MMTRVYLGMEHVPVWAMRYLTEGDSAAMTDEEKLIVREFVGRYRGVECLTFKCDDRRPVMCHRPAFGMPAECVEVHVHGHE